MAEHSANLSSMDAHQKTFNGFVTFVKRAVIAIAVFLVFLAIVNG
ncbi:MAG: aa3-type cytochrome c oxidase subunit IV [Pseudorhodobacter sp.]|jgi:hypothetical protein|nr:aa3-type cytochrome c oxidase subunit IV [Pseudorhodobacter sp.]